MRKRPVTPVLRILAAALLACSLLSAGAAINADHYLNHVRYLASEEMRGRGTGTPELEKAAHYIAKQFKDLGVKPADGKNYLQEFSVTTNAKMGSHNHFDVRNGTKKALKLNEEFIPLNSSAGGKASGKLVFAGYGITAREYNYDDYAGLDVKDKIVVVLRHEPQEFDENSVFAGKTYTEHAQIPSKASNAKVHGAKAVILVNDVGNHSGDEDALEKFSRNVGPGDTGVPFVQVKASVAEGWFAQAGKSIKDLETEIDKDLKPRSFDFPASLTATVDVDVQREHKTVHNVAAYLPGETDEYVVIGAHYDHLGLGEQYSMAPSMAGTPHPGADDNASGTAGVLELARYFAAQPKQRRGILFLTFAGEELGLLGSRFWVDHPELPITKAVAMINMDMIGRIREGRVFVGGAGTGTTLKSLVEGLAGKYPLKLDFSEQAGYGSSDHFSFTTRQVPVLFFFSGLHSDYHKPSDTWDKIDAKDAATLLELVADVTVKLAGEPGRPQYVRVAPPKMAMGGAGGGGYGAYFGSVPDFGEIPKGVKFADVRDESPAAKAGLKAGDILIEFDGKDVGNLYDFTTLLRARKPGDEVKVKVLRDGKPLETKAVLGKR